ncbi:MAG: LysR family transcriptional regulator [Pseudomonadota bacterium]
MADWDDLRFVLETFRQEGISGAARVLGVNHSTVSRRIASAEDEFGARLFDRLPRGYRATEAGQQVAKVAEQMEDLHADLARAIGARDKALSGPLTVTAPQLLFSSVLTPILSDFIDAHPNIELTFLASNETLNLSRREADVAIRVAEAPHDTLFGTRVAEQRSAVYVSAEYARRISEDPERHLRWLRFVHWSGIPKEVKTVWPNSEVVMQLDDMVAVHAAILAGQGASRMPCFLGDPDPRLVRLPGTPLFPYPSIWVLTHSDLRSMVRVSVFMEFMARRLRALRGMFDGSDVRNRGKPNP